MLRALVTLTLLPASLVAASAAPSVAATCRGLEATVVGAPGEVATGTPGSDVIVANGSKKVRALAGDDVICLTGAQRYDVEADEGDDDVSVAPGYDYLFVDAGTGSDTVTGGAARDVVQLTEDGTDVVRTLRGDDNVSTLSSETGTSVTVELGAGNDQFAPTYRDAAPSRAEVVGGDGRDRLYLELAHVEGVVAELDLSARTFDEDGQERMESFTGFEDAEVSGVIELAPRVAVLGDDGVNRLTLDGIRDAHVDLGGGADLLYLRAGSDLLEGSSTSGGAGRDRLQTDGNSRFAVRIDLAAGLLTMVGTTSDIDGFEDATVKDKARLTGDSGPNRLQGGCRSVIEGRGGDDLLVGSGCGDTLIGGRGRDRAWGRAGVDTCVAEMKRRCER